MKSQVSSLKSKLSNNFISDKFDNSLLETYLKIENCKLKICQSGGYYA